MPPDSIKLLKLLWHPDDVSGEVVLPTAFRRDELSGKDGCSVSVDRKDLAQRATMEALAARQKLKADGIQHFREIASIGEIHCQSVRSFEYEGTPALLVVSDPIVGNDAHCGIKNATDKRGNGYMTAVRSKLAELASPPISFDEAYEASSQ